MRCVILALALAGCADFGSDFGGDLAPANELAGTTWSLGKGQCSDIFVFYLDGRDYRNIFGCNLPDGSTAEKIVAGSYSLSGDSITFFASQTSCPAGVVQPVSKFTLGMVGSTMILSTPDGVSAYGKVHQTEPGSVVKPADGCFGSDGSFFPMPLHSI